MLTSDFDYYLPKELIAQHPPAVREAARMLVLDRGADTVTHRIFTALPEYLKKGDLVVLNDTKVFPARLKGHWQDTPGKVEMLLLEPLSEENCWEALSGSGRPFKAGNVAVFGEGAVCAELVRRSDRTEGAIIVRLRFSGELGDLLDLYGETPLPPYITRNIPNAALRREDAERYQTVYAERVGAVAAPTAGLHFNKEMLAELASAGIDIAKITLHVGPGTFRPVQVENPDDHPMHSERYEVPEAAAAAIRACRSRGGRILCVGSTTVRTLETMAAEHNGEAVACSGRSRLFIREPYRFHFTDMMLTNFHLPKSTLIMMVAALAGRDRILSAYREAVEEQYKFFSYGDCMLIK